MKILRGSMETFRLYLNLPELSAKMKKIKLMNKKKIIATIC